MTDTTIVIATQSRPDWFEQARASALSQGCYVIVVDDAGSGYAQGDVVFEEPVGYARARLAGLALVETEFAAFLDDDDVLMPSWLQRSRAVMQDCDVVAASYIETDAAMVRLRTHILQPATLDDLRIGVCHVNDGALIRMSVLAGVRFRPDRDTAMMFSLWLDLAAKGARFDAVAEPVWYRRLHDTNMSAATGEADARWRQAAMAEHA